MFINIELTIRLIFEYHDVVLSSEAQPYFRQCYFEILIQITRTRICIQIKLLN